MAQRVTIGLATTDITPPVGVELAGGAFGPSTSVLHPLLAQAMFLTNGRTQAILIATDLIGFSTPLATEIRAAVAARCNLPIDNVMLTATHTHNGPATVWYHNWGRPDPAYIRRLRGQLVALAERAAESPEPARIGAAYGRCEGIAVNRVEGGTITDDQLGVIRIDSPAGEPRAVMLNYACHPVTLHSHRGIISPDFPHFVRRRIAGALGANVAVFYLTGASGDLNPAGFPEAQQPDAPAYAASVGGKLGDAALHVLAGLGSEPFSELSCLTGTFQIPLAPLPSERTLEEAIRRREAELSAIESPGPTNWRFCLLKTTLEWAHATLAEIRSGRPAQTARATPLQAFRVGAAAIAAVPGELFVEYGMEIKRESQFPVTLVAETANGCEGYFSTPHAYKVRSYDATVCPLYLGPHHFYRPETAELLTRQCTDILRRLPE